MLTEHVYSISTIVLALSLDAHDFHIVQIYINS